MALSMYRWAEALKMIPMLGPVDQGEEENLMANWKCANCGYEMEADKPPEKCPSCKESCEFLDNSCYTPDCAGSTKDPRIG